MLEEMRKMSAEQLNCEESEITADTSFKDDLGADSLDLMDLVMSFEDEFGVEIDTEMNNRSNSCGERIVSSENARVICAVIPTNEEKMIALDAIHLGKVNAPAEFA